jgi:hypothetical protein
MGKLLTYLQSWYTQKKDKEGYARKAQPLLFAPALTLRVQSRWWRCRDLNPGHCGYEPHALTN